MDGCHRIAGASPRQRSLTQPTWQPHDPYKARALHGRRDALRFGKRSSAAAGSGSHWRTCEAGKGVASRTAAPHCARGAEPGAQRRSLPGSNFAALAPQPKAQRWARCGAVHLSAAALFAALVAPPTP